MHLLRLLEEKIALLARMFAASPLQCFHEQELHAEFYCLAREALGTAVPRASPCPVHLLRYEYDTIWRYRGTSSPGTPFVQRYDAEGTTGCIDFALLKEEFVVGQPLVAVVNKDEARRKALRVGVADGPAFESPAILAGIEFKMAHVRSAPVLQRDEGGFAAGMQVDARKLALEGIRHGYVLGFSHGPWPSPEEAERIARGTWAQYLAHCSGGDVRILVATPARTIVLGGWAQPALFPNPVVLG